MTQTTQAPNRLAGRTALITGGTDGIGFGIAQALLSQGARVCVAGRTQERAEEASALIPVTNERDFFYVQTDVAVAEQREALVAATLAKFGALDILVNNAGTSVRGRPEDLSLTDYEAVMQVNLTAAFHLSQLALPSLRISEAGRIINIASLMSTFGSPFSLPYSVSKGGIVQLTKSLALAWADEGVLVNAIAPGWIDTDLTQATRAHVPALNDTVLNRTPLHRWGTALEVGNVAAFLASSDASFINGTTITVDGGYSASI